MFFRHPRWQRAALRWCCLLLCLVQSCSRDNTRADQRTGQGTDQRADARAPSVDRAATDDFGAALPADASFATRVVSLNPTATEVIFALGVQDKLVGRSRWDEFPAAVSSIPALGDGIRPNIETLIAARPTLVVLYASAENRSAAEALARAGIRTIALKVDRIADFFALTTHLGVALGAQSQARVVVDSVQRTLDAVRRVTATVPSRSVVWPLWQQPVMAVGGGSYLDELIEIAGGRNIFHDLSAPSPPVSIEEIARRNPSLIVASRATRDVLLKQPQWQAVAAVRSQQFIVHDPTKTGRPSVVLGMAAASLAHALHPELAAQLPTVVK